MVQSDTFELDTEQLGALPIINHDPVWTEAASRPGRRWNEPEQVWWTTPAPWPSAEGYRVVWVKSSAKVDYDAEARADRIARGLTALDQPCRMSRLMSPP